jgi:hypothetical protein
MPWAECTCFESRRSFRDVPLLHAVVVPAGADLVAAPPPGPAQAEGKAGAGDQPGGVLAGQAFEPGGLGDGEPDRGDAGRARLAAADGDRSVTEGNHQVSVVHVLVLAVSGDAGACGVPEVRAARELQR